jgi:hypothetical protein
VCTRQICSGTRTHHHRDDDDAISSSLINRHGNRISSTTTDDSDGGCGARQLREVRRSCRVNNKVSLQVFNKASAMSSLTHKVFRRKLADDFSAH